MKAIKLVKKYMNGSNFDLDQDEHDHITLKARDRFNALETIKTKINETHDDASFQKKRFMCSVISFLTVIAGILLLLWGFAVSIFLNYHRNYVLIIIGFFLVIPGIAVFLYSIIPNKNIREIINAIRQRKEYNNMPNMVQHVLVNARAPKVQEYTRVEIDVKLRGTVFRIKAATLGELCYEIQCLTGLPISQQLIKFLNHLVPMNLEKPLNDYYGFKDGDMLHVYNRGGFERAIYDSDTDGYESVVGRNRSIVGSYNATDNSVRNTKKFHGLKSKDSMMHKISDDIKSNGKTAAKIYPLERRLSDMSDITMESSAKHRR